MTVKKFRCGLCKDRNQYVGTRKGLREHLRKDHRILNRITNFTYRQETGYEKQNWWIVEDWE